MNNEAKIHFAQRLSFLLDAGIALREALVILESQAEKKHRIFFSQIVADISRGVSLSESLRRSKKWSAFAVQIVAVGEMSGALAPNLGYLAEELKKRHILKRKIQGALVYPAFVTVAAGGIAILMAVSIFPKILPIFKSMNVELPITTRALIFASDMIGGYWMWLFAFGVTLLCALVFFGKKYPRLKYSYYALLHRVPIFSKIIKYATVANITRTLGLLLKSGITLDAAVEVLGRVMTDPLYQKELVVLHAVLKKGGRISDYLKKCPQLFDPIVPQMLAIGEATGNLARVSVYLSELYEREVDELAKGLSSAIEPVLMIIMGLAVGFVAVAVISPMYAITQNIHH